MTLFREQFGHTLLKSLLPNNENGSREIQVPFIISCAPSWHQINNLVMGSVWPDNVEFFLSSLRFYDFLLGNSACMGLLVSATARLGDSIKWLKLFLFQEE